MTTPGDGVGEDHREGFDLDEPASEPPTSAEPEAETEEAAEVAEETVEPPGPPTYEILVRLLGEIRVEGARRPCTPRPPRSPPTWRSTEP
jgi:hypothetical protein